jgi:phosphoserine phosphatase RsbU/P
MFTITATSGPATGRRVEIGPAGLVLGRQAGVGLTLDDPAVSRRHARIAAEGDALYVEDLGSINGTFVNETRIALRTRLRSTDSIRVGGNIFRIAPDAPEQGDITIQRQTVTSAGNAEIFRENASEKLQAVLRLAGQLARSVDPDALLDRLMDQLLALFPHADRAMAIMGAAAEPAAKVVRTRAAARASGPAFSRTVLRKVFDEGVAVLAADTGRDPALQANMSLHAIGVRSLVCAPLPDHDGRIIGALQMDRFQTGRPFTEEDLHLLVAVSLMVSTVLENARLHHSLIAAERMKRDLAMAREIQLGYLPKEPVRLEGGPFELHAELHPASDVSGDFYDYFPLDASRLAFLVADVSGKGMPAALFMTLVHALARNAAVSTAGPAEWLVRLNEAVARDNPNFLFVTVAAGVFDARTGGLRLALGGHPPPLLRRRGGAVEVLNPRRAPVLGVQLPIETPGEAAATLEPGDALLFYTDGVTESPLRPDGGPMFGEKRLVETIGKFSDEAPLADWHGAIRAAVRRFSGDGPPADDLTLLTLRRPR